MKVLQSDTFLGTRGLLHLCSAYVSSSNVYVYWDGKVMKGLFIISAVDKGAFVLRFCIRKLRWCCHIEYTSLKEKIRVTPKTILLQCVWTWSSFWLGMQKGIAYKHEVKKIELDVLDIDNPLE